MDPADLTTLAARPGDLPAPLALLSLGFAFFVGACWGSFLNVVVARVPEGLSVVHPRSRCPKCKTQIAATDNIPILSWVLLRGRCRSCAAPISVRYPLLELVLALSGTAAVARAGWSVEALETFVFIFLLVAIAFVDLDTWTVPNPLWMGLLGSGLAFAVVRMLEVDSAEILVSRAIGAAGGGIFLGAVMVSATGILRRTKRLAADQEAMGLGDPLILAGVGAFLGWRLLPVVLFLGSAQGAIVGIALRMGGRLAGDKAVSETDDWVPPRGAVPFGPFLALGALEAAFFGDALLAWLFSLWGLGDG